MTGETVAGTGTPWGTGASTVPGPREATVPGQRVKLTQLFWSQDKTIMLVAIII